MPFKSEKQRRYLWMHEPKLAKKWSDKYGSTPEDYGKKVARRKKKARKKSS